MSKPEGDLIKDTLWVSPNTALKHYKISVAIALSAENVPILQF